MHIVEDSSTLQMAVLRRNHLGCSWLRRGSALLRPRRTAEGTPSASRLDPLARSVRRVRAQFSDRLLGINRMADVECGTGAINRAPTDCGMADTEFGHYGIYYF